MVRFELLVLSGPLVLLPEGGWAAAATVSEQRVCLWKAVLLHSSFCVCALLLSKGLCMCE